MTVLPTTVGGPVRVTIEQTGECYPCAITETLLRGMTRIGRRGIPAGCLNGGCGVCRIRIVLGKVDAVGPMSRAHVSEQEQAQGYVLACRVMPQTDVTLSLAGRLGKTFARTASAVSSNGKSSSN